MTKEKPTSNNALICGMSSADCTAPSITRLMEILQINDGFSINGAHFRKPKERYNDVNTDTVTSSVGKHCYN